MTLDTTATRRRLIVNADDFGRSAGINRGIVQSHEQGIVTSASLMVCWPDSVAAAAYARSQTSLSVGLHIDVGEWSFRNGSWRALYHWIDADDPASAAREAGMQLERFRDLIGRDPTHLDSHQHVHRRSPMREVLAHMAVSLGVPLRHFSSVHYCGDFYGQTATGQPLPHLIAPASLTAVLRRLPSGVTELACHPGIGDDVESMYRQERHVELRTLCDGTIRHVLDEEEIRLVSFSDVGTLCRI